MYDHLHKLCAGAKFMVDIETRSEVMKKIEVYTRCRGENHFENVRAGRG